MKAERLLFVIFVLVGVLFIVGSTLHFKTLFTFSNFFLIPILLLYYRCRTRKLFRPIAVSLVLLYIRDVFLIYGFQSNPEIIWTSFLLAMFLLFLSLITGFERSKVHPLEIVSFLIMYGFLTFLFVSLSELVPEVLPGREILAYLYLLLLMFLLAGCFTSYLMKSHLASLWFMVAASSFLVSEVSLFFKVFILEDFSVNFFYPFFHVLAYYGLVEYGVRRRRTGKLKYF